MAKMAKSEILGKMLKNSRKSSSIGVKTDPPGGSILAKIGQIGPFWGHLGVVLGWVKIDPKNHPKMTPFGWFWVV